MLPADTATVLAYMAHHNTAEQMRANIWRAVLIRIVTALVESRCQITPVDVTTLAETPVGQTFKTAFIPKCATSISPARPMPPQRNCSSRIK